MSPLPRARGAEVESRPGRSCPVSYRYSPRVFDREPEIVASAVYVVGGLYGNVEALDAVTALAAREPGKVTLVFNGDFHWFDADDADFTRISREVLAHAALRGNVETELAHDDSGAGCGCAYPADVSDAVVSRSNEILERLRGTARRHPDLRERLAALPMHLTARIGAARVGIVHGDASSLAGWGFDRERLDDPSHQRWLRSMFEQSRMDLFASTHTCVPALRTFSWPGGPGGAVANNGAAGMPNFHGTRFGLLTRIGVDPYRGEARLHGFEIAGVHVDALRIDYHHDAWTRRFLASWPAGSAAHASYWHRIAAGPASGLEPAAPRR